MLSRISSLIGTVGKNVTVKQITSTYNSSTRQSSESVTDHSVKAFISGNVGSSQKIAGIIPENSKLIYIAAKDLTFTPRPKLDKVTVDSKNYSIVSCNPRHISNSTALLVLMVTLDGN